MAILKKNPLISCEHPLCVIRVLNKNKNKIKTMKKGKKREKRSKINLILSHVNCT
jgi:hypothetical protein